MMIILIVVAVIVGILSTGYLVALAVWGRQATRGRRAILRKRDRVLREVHEQGRATRERIRLASHQLTFDGLDHVAELRRPQRRRRRTHVFVSLAALAAALLTVTFAIGRLYKSSSDEVPRHHNFPRITVDSLRVGDCISFLGGIRTVMPADLQIVSCHAHSATFKIVWQGHSRKRHPCPTRYRNPQRWSSPSGITACMTRIYHVGQCMLGARDRTNKVTWYNNAVVPCSKTPTRTDPYVVRIIKLIIHDHGSCPYYSYVELVRDSGSSRFLCVRLVRRFR